MKARWLSDKRYVPSMQRFENVKPDTSILNKPNEKIYFKKLTEDILENGVKNPILAWTTGPLDTNAVYGLSRLYIAQKYDLEVPMFVVDWYHMWDSLEEVTTLSEAMNKFDEPPHTIVFNDKTFNFVMDRYPWDPMLLKHMNI